MPSQPSRQAHVPLARHAPWPEHSVSVHESRPAHCRRAHVGPPHPKSQRHLPSWHSPWPEQSVSHWRYSQAGPVKPEGQWQYPSTHTPFPEQMPPAVDEHSLV